MLDSLVEIVGEALFQLWRKRKSQKSAGAARVKDIESEYGSYFEDCVVEKEPSPVAMVSEDWDVSDGKCSPNGDSKAEDGGEELWSITPAVNAQPVALEECEEEEGAFGIISEVLIGEGAVVLNNQFQVKCVKTTYGVPVVGDRVKLCKINGDLILKPLRSKRIRGIVTGILSKREVVIDDNIYLCSKELERRVVRNGDFIRCLVIESRQKNLPWRGILEEDESRVISDEDIEEVALLTNKNDMEITEELHLDFSNLGQTRDLQITVINIGTTKQVLNNVVTEKLDYNIKLVRPESGGLSGEYPLEVKPKQEYFLLCSYTSKYFGDNQHLIVFKFDGFDIGRRITVCVSHPKFDGIMQRSSRYTQFARRKTDYEVLEKANRFRQRYLRGECIVIPGIKAWKPKGYNQVRMKQYYVPDRFFDALQSNQPLEEVAPVLRAPLTNDNYVDKFRCLLYAEESAMYAELRHYDMQLVSLSRYGEFLSLTVPGLAEGRPCLVVGDLVFLTHPRGDSKFAYEGCIHEVRKDDILVKFYEEFHARYLNECFNVSFQFSRTVLRRNHFALDLAPKWLGETILFPSDIVMKKPLCDMQYNFDNIKWYNPLLNEKQKLAVISILRGMSRPTPYLIFGPPGTGKTVTVVEAILQVLDKDNSCRILACTTSNSCADLIATRLLASGRVTPNELVRLLANSRTNSCPAELEDVAVLSSEQDTESWLFHKIIITTCSTCGTLYSRLDDTSHFTHCFIDEAAQATEPECLVPISLVSSGVIVLCGDPYQLGPVCVSETAKRCGLGMALMARLIDLKPYQRQEAFSEFGYYNPRFITKLIVSYRCEQRLINVNSLLFYKSELKCVKPPDHELLEKMGLKFPVIFHGIKGQDLRENDNPSWFNPVEVYQCVCYVRQLYECGLKPTDIGIISPYRKQSQKIRLLLSSCELEECKVATIEEFQGGEKRAMIITMVRNTSDFIQHDLKYNLGFIFHEKRFNVATSRSKSLLIVIGDPFLLSKDDCWQTLLTYCLKNGGYVGCSLGRMQAKLMN